MTKCEIPVCPVKYYWHPGEKQWRYIPRGEVKYSKLSWAHDVVDSRMWGIVKNFLGNKNTQGLQSPQVSAPSYYLPLSNSIESL